MIFEDEGLLDKYVIKLGRHESCVYLLNGEAGWAFIGGGMVHIIPEVLDLIDRYEFDERYIKRIIILHSHFDHCGIVPYIKKKWPWITVTASARTKELLAKDKVIAGHESLNKMILEYYDCMDLYEKYDLEFKGIEVEEVVKDGDILQVGDLSLEILEVPGHSSCSIAAYCPERESLFASDSAGVIAGDGIFSAGNSNYDLYQKNLERMSSYKITYLLLEHFAALTHKEAEEYLPRSIAAAKDFRKKMENSLDKTRDVKTSTGELTEEIMKNAPENFLPEKLVKIVVGQMLRFIEKSQKK